ncbi:hypothetical protein [Turicibacter sanguinis]|uniref:hypothetical protein n=1 Tax=Turicibacter sanguinis TaxID=154288 RepID=UPI00325AF56C|nr:hypothetical protein [Collinsella aerofaciens]MCB5369000.1 hypothetical protein [Collinsella aerofaciens]
MVLEREKDALKWILKRLERNRKQLEKQMKQVGIIENKVDKTINNLLTKGVYEVRKMNSE